MPRDLHSSVLVISPRDVHPQLFLCARPGSQHLPRPATRDHQHPACPQLPARQQQPSGRLQGSSRSRSRVPQLHFPPGLQNLSQQSPRARHHDGPPSITPEARPDGHVSAATRFWARGQACGPQGSNNARSPGLIHTHSCCCALARRPPHPCGSPTVSRGVSTSASATTSPQLASATSTVANNAVPLTSPAKRFDHHYHLGQQYLHHHLHAQPFMPAFGSPQVSGGEHLDKALKSVCKVFATIACACVRAYCFACAL